MLSEVWSPTLTSVRARAVRNAVAKAEVAGYSEAHIAP